MRLQRSFCGLALFVLVLAAIAGDAGAARQAQRAPVKIRYMLEIDFVGRQDMRQTANGKPTLEAHRVTTYEADTQSVFVISRSGSRSKPVFDFHAPLHGEFRHLGVWKNYLSGTGCVTTWTEKGVSVWINGFVSLMGRNPSPLYISMKVADPLQAVKYDVVPVQCGTKMFERKYCSAAECLVHRASEITKPVDLRTRFGRAFTLTFRDTHASEVQEAVWTYKWTLAFRPAKRR